jgi:hypothetical protein
MPPPAVIAPVTAIGLRRLGTDFFASLSTHRRRSGSQRQHLGPGLTADRVGSQASCRLSRVVSSFWFRALQREVAASLGAISSSLILLWTTSLETQDERDARIDIELTVGQNLIRQGDWRDEGIRRSAHLKTTTLSRSPLPKSFRDRGWLPGGFASRFG